MAKLILKYNAAVGKDRLPDVLKIAKRLNLNIEKIDEEVPSAGKRLKVISVFGDQSALLELKRELIRFPSITTKLVEQKFQKNGSTLKSNVT